MHRISVCVFLFVLFYNRVLEKKKMSISMDTQSCVPPGFRFHPTEEELLNYYLRKKVAAEVIDLDVIRDVDLNKLEPWDIQEKCRIMSTPQNEWYLFSQKDKKYPTGTRTNRATAAGFWKATGRDKVIYSSCRRIGMRKTLVFYKGRAPHGQKLDWIMHEYRLDDLIPQSNITSSAAEATNQEDGWVVCRVFKKKSLHTAMGSSNSCSSMLSNIKTQLLHSTSDDALEQILQKFRRSCNQESKASDATCNTSSTLDIINDLSCVDPFDQSTARVQERFMSPTYCGYQTGYLSAAVDSQPESAGIGDWAAFDRLLASQLDGPSAEQTKLQFQCFDDHVFNLGSAVECTNGGDDVDVGDLWSLTWTAYSASTDPIAQERIERTV